VAAALQKALVCTPKLGYRTSLSAVLRESPAGLRRVRFQRYGAASTVGGFRHGPTRARARHVFSRPKKRHGLSPSSENGIVWFPLCRFRSVVFPILPLVINPTEFRQTTV